MLIAYKETRCTHYMIYQQTEGTCKCFVLTN